MFIDKIHELLSSLVLGRAAIPAASMVSQAQPWCRSADIVIMSAIEQAEELRQQAIQLLLAEQELIGERLLQLGYDQETSPVDKRRG